MVTTEIFRQVPLFSGLEEADLASLINVASRRKYPKDAVVFFENDLGGRALHDPLGPYQGHDPLR